MLGLLEELLSALSLIGSHSLAERVLIDLALILLSWWGWLSPSYIFLL